MTEKDNIENKINTAVALSYDPDKDLAPKIIAQGRGQLAEQIINIAKEYGVEIREDETLAEILSKLDLDTHIPLEAYAAIAEILSFIYKNKKQKTKDE